MSDLTTYIHVGVTILTALGAAFLAITQYHDKRLTEKMDAAQDFKQKIIDLELNQAVLTERLNGEKENITKIDDKINVIMKKLIK
jgi:hypothetical protein